jgi:hypothetical protein
MTTSHTHRLPPLLIIAMVIGLTWACLSCRVSRPRETHIRVPDMQSERDVRIITNAVADEIAGQVEGTQYVFEIDVAQRLVMYHEGPNLLKAGYREAIRTRIAEVGYAARFLEARHNPPPPVRVANSPTPVQMWPYRCTAVLHIPEMASQTAANIIVDAIGYARRGRDPDALRPDPVNGMMHVDYESMQLSIKNLEHAIAAVGYRANALGANLGNKDAVADGWRPVRMARTPRATQR